MPGVKRMHVLQGPMLPGWTPIPCVIFSQVDAVTAAVKRDLIALARGAGLLEPIEIVATCPLQWPAKILEEMGLVPMHPLLYNELPAQVRNAKAVNEIHKPQALPTGKAK